MSKMCGGRGVGVAVSRFVETLEHRKLFSALVNIRMVVDGGANDGATSLQVTPSQVVNYKLIAKIAPVGTTNTTNNVTINSLTTSPTDGITQLRFNVQQAAGDAIQTTFTPVSLQNGFGASFSSTGTAEARGSTGNNNLNGVKAIQPIGTFVGVASANTPADVVVATGSFTVKTLGNGATSNIFMSYLNPDQTPLAMRINNGQGAAGAVGNSDPMVSFNGLQLTSAPNSTISGRVFNDKNANGIFDGVDTGISGFRVFLDQDGDGILDVGETSKPVSATGTYHFTGIGAGTYRVREVFREGWRQSFPALGYYEVTLGNNDTAKSQSFANTDTVLIKGRVWMDADKDKKIDAAEGGIPGWLLWLDQDNDAILDSNETTATSDANGNYRFFNMAAGKYVVRVQTSPKYRLTAPAAGTHTVTLGAAGTVSNKNFGLKRL